MFEVLIFENNKGESSVKSRIEELQKKSETDKGSRIAFKKILEYIAVLERCGTRAGEKYTKHIEGDIWELRPLNDRIFFFCWIDKRMVLLHCFRKKTQKTPKKEIDQAKRNLYVFLEDKEKMI
jgi:phage-related protein